MPPLCDNSARASVCVCVTRLLAAGNPWTTPCGGVVVLLVSVGPDLCCALVTISNCMLWVFKVSGASPPLTSRPDTLLFASAVLPLWHAVDAVWAGLASC
jgi:hypothetical protein